MSCSLAAVAMPSFAPPVAAPLKTPNRGDVSRVSTIARLIRIPRPWAICASRVDDGPLVSGYTRNDDEAEPDEQASTIVPRSPTQQCRHVAPGYGKALALWRSQRMQEASQTFGAHTPNHIQILFKSQRDLSLCR